MKYAFIDFQNTDNTTKQLLGFSIDWKKLCDFLKNNWKCAKVFLYMGVDDRDLEMAKISEELKNSGFIVRDKKLFSYKNKDREINVSCPKCGNKFKELRPILFRALKKLELEKDISFLDYQRN